MNNFRREVIKKFPKATFISSGENEIAYDIQDEKISIIGCSLCYDNRNIRKENNDVMIKNTKAVKMKSLSVDDSVNPTLDNLFLCPVCQKIIVHPDISYINPIGRGFDIESGK